jgi:hypothetical protein
MLQLATKAAYFSGKNPTEREFADFTINDAHNVCGRTEHLNGRACH